MAIRTPIYLGVYNPKIGVRYPGCGQITFAQVRGGLSPFSSNKKSPPPLSEGLFSFPQVRGGSDQAAQISAKTLIGVAV